uniref:Uncharacterized protein n=1 Tax=Globodera rostochiensis TaxID=31243 RepID=A0A914HIV7_GLORO
MSGPNGQQCCERSTADASLYFDSFGKISGCECPQARGSPSLSAACSVLFLVVTSMELFPKKWEPSGATSEWLRAVPTQDDGTAQQFGEIAELGFGRYGLLGEGVLQWLGERTRCGCRGPASYRFTDGQGSEYVELSETAHSSALKFESKARRKADVRVPQKRDRRDQPIDLDTIDLN